MISREGTKVRANLKPSGETGVWRHNHVGSCSFQAGGKSAQSRQGIFMQRGGRERGEVQFWEIVFHVKKRRLSTNWVACQNRKGIQPVRELRQGKVTAP